MTAADRIARLRGQGQPTFGDVVFSPADVLALCADYETLAATSAALDNALLHLADEEADHVCPAEGCWSWEAAHEKWTSR